MLTIYFDYMYFPSFASFFFAPTIKMERLPPSSLRDSKIPYLTASYILLGARPSPMIPPTDTMVGCTAILETSHFPTPLVMGPTSVTMH